jgi:hypothetical protein
MILAPFLPRNQFVGGRFMAGEQKGMLVPEEHGVGSGKSGGEVEGEDWGQ